MLTHRQLALALSLLRTPATSTVAARMSAGSRTSPLPSVDRWSNVRRLDTSEPAIALSRDAGEFPVFLYDGRTLALVRGRQLVVRSWRENNGRFEIGPERVVAPLAFGSGWTFGAPYEVAPDGRFLALVRTEASPPPRIRVVVGWDPAASIPATQ